MRENNCRHKWKKFPTYKQCSKCGYIIFSQEMSIINGIISDENDCSDILFSDEEEQTDVPPLNDRRD